MLLRLLFVVYCFGVLVVCDLRLCCYNVWGLFSCVWCLLVVLFGSLVADLFCGWFGF